MKRIPFCLFFVLALVACETENPPVAVYGKLEQENGNLLKITKDGKLYTEIVRDASGQIVEKKQYYSPSEKPMMEKYTYNADNQIIKREYSETLTDTYVYEDGRLAEMVSTNSTNSGWNIKLVYRYDSKNRITKADEYHNGKKAGYILFEYDRRGNAVSRKHYSGESSDLLISEYRCSYDDNKNPFHDLSSYPLDMVQHNNVISLYRYMVVMSSMPVTRTIRYEYNKSKFPSASSVYVAGHAEYPKENFTYEYK